MKQLSTKYYEEFNNLIGREIPDLISKFDFTEENGGFEYLTKASAVFSSNIEGNSIDLNSFMNYEMNKDKFKSGKEIEEIENLIMAYEFAQQNPVSEKNLLHSHLILSETLLIKSKRGKYRTEPVGVFGKSGLAYLAIEPEKVSDAMDELFLDIQGLKQQKLEPTEVFYFASYIHLRFAHIHPFRDGNGRAARLLEKWFLAEKLGEQFWKVSSEEYYKTNQQNYYDRLNLGVNYYELDYSNCVNFLSMLPNSMKKGA